MSVAYYLISEVQKLLRHYVQLMPNVVALEVLDRSMQHQHVDPTAQIDRRTADGSVESLRKSAGQQVACACKPGIPIERQAVVVRCTAIAVQPWQAVQAICPQHTGPVTPCILHMPHSMAFTTDNAVRSACPSPGPSPTAHSLAQTTHTTGIVGVSDTTAQPVREPMLALAMAGAQ